MTLAFTGATLGTALDAIHVHAATTAYTRPALAAVIGTSVETLLVAVDG